MIALLENTAFMKLLITIVIAGMPVAYKYLGINDSVTLVVVGAVASTFGIYAFSNIASQRIDAGIERTDPLKGGP